MSSESHQTESIGLQIRMQWPKQASVGAQYANMFAVTPGFPTPGGQEEVIYVIAGLAPPPIITDEATARALTATGLQVDIEPVATLVVPLSRARELRDLLNGQLQGMDEATRGTEP
ncbi:hypothetical protein [Promicromonospora sp. NFX87]|uniref:hypothetical protein n=1 Tax=Promicromonospora sp. NFX87 TaxID=3402691 RepID=UPI003AFAA1F0